MKTERDGGVQGSTEERVQALYKQLAPVSKWQMAPCMPRISLTWWLGSDSWRLSVGWLHQDPCQVIQSEKVAPKQLVMRHNTRNPNFKFSQQHFKELSFTRYFDWEECFCGHRHYGRCVLRKKNKMHYYRNFNSVYFYKRSIVCEVYNISTYNISTSTIY